mmetsp:Transcript_462/g.428  ORF Transcript_462/g.428 Transcript_462/m.428 type:complete len:202 (-) Transcript_462:680-1285(-)
MKEKEGIEELVQKLQEFEFYRGYALIIFNTIESRNHLKNFFKDQSFWDKWLSCCFPCCHKTQYRFFGKIPLALNAPEPQDFIFENVYTSKRSQKIREGISLGLGVVIVAGGAAFIIASRVEYYNNDKFFDIPYWLYSGIYVAISLISKFLADFLINKIMIRRKQSAFEMNRISFRLKLSFIAVNIYFYVLLWTFDQDFFRE